MMVAVFATMSLALICGWLAVGYSRSRCQFPAIRKTADVLSLYVIVICLINLVSVILQCGFGECHTFSYKLLQ